MWNWMLVVLLALGVGGVAQADFDTGLRAYQNGDYQAAVQAWRPLAAQGDTKAQFWLGSMYYRGQGVPRNVPVALRWVRRAAELGNVEAQAALGSLYFFGDDQVPANDREAQRWFRMAAEQGHPEAQVGLGNMYFLGRGVVQDEAAAAKWFRAAADQGVPQAQGLLGTMYFFGQGVPRDYVQAYKWLHLAAQQGFQEAAKIRNAVAGQMSADQVRRAEGLARSWRPDGPSE